ncbi:MAG: hypothetical protein ACREMA_04600 [Longimicrobiales bacterium]
MPIDTPSPVLVMLFIALAAAGPARAQSDDRMTIVIGKGPHAGTYKLDPGNMTCLHAKERKQFSAAYSDGDARDAKVIKEVGINVFKGDIPAEKNADVSVTFGDGKTRTEYAISIPSKSRQTVSMTRKGGTVELAFHGVTKAGIPLQMTAFCGNVFEF